MNIELSKKEFRRLLDMVYIGNWVLNSARGNDRFEDYDLIEEKLFGLCEKNGLGILAGRWQGRVYPSREFEEGGIHEAIADYEDAVFFEILAEELARRDLSNEQKNPEDLGELTERIEEYISEFEQNGIENISLDI